VSDSAERESAAMTNPANGRTDSASRVIKASAKKIYAAFLDPKAVATWLPPSDMTGTVQAFEAWQGGLVRIALTYNAPPEAGGKTTENTDVVEGRFVELLPDTRIVQVFRFQSDDPAFAGDMTQIWELHPDPGGTRVTITCKNVPRGIRKEDHDIGLNSTLENLAKFVER
jgi:uncharacterized protein YndB with AHSA1/START domain